MANPKKDEGAGEFAGPKASGDAGDGKPAKKAKTPKEPKTPRAEKTAAAPAASPERMSGKYVVLEDFSGTAGHLTRHSAGAVSLPKGTVVNATHQPVAAWVRQGLKVKPVEK
jgi:hypothetical protein